MSGFSEEDVGQLVVVDNPIWDPSQHASHVGLFDESGDPFASGGGGTGLLIFDALMPPLAHSGFDIGSFDNTALYNVCRYSVTPIIGDYMEWRQYVVAGSWRFDWCGIRFATGGYLTFQIDGVDSGVFDFYSPSLQHIAFPGPVTVDIEESGYKTFKFVTKGDKNPASGGIGAVVYKCQAVLIEEA